MEKLLEADVCGIEHLQPGESFDKPQVRHNQMVVEVDDPYLGRIQQVGTPVKLDGVISILPGRHRGQGTIRPTYGVGRKRAHPRRLPSGTPDRRRSSTAYGCWTSVPITLAPSLHGCSLISVLT